MQNLCAILDRKAGCDPRLALSYCTIPYLASCELTTASTRNHARSWLYRHYFAAASRLRKSPVAMVHCGGIPIA